VAVRAAYAAMRHGLDAAIQLRDAVYLSSSEAARTMDDGLQDLENRIDVWLTFQDEIDDPSLLTAFASLLDAEETRRNAAYHFARDRKCHLITRALVRTVLSRYAPVLPKDWAFTTNAYGKPAIVNAVPAAKGLAFNVSHTQGLIALAVARKGRLGIDVENADAHDGLAALAVDVLSADELSAFRSLPSTRREHAFLRHWTLKEAYVKARGAGLSIPLTRFSIGHVSPCVQQMHGDPAVADGEAHWVFAQYQIAQRFVLALCSSHSENNPSALRFRKVVPLLTEEALLPQPLGCLFPHAHPSEACSAMVSEQPLTT